MVFALSCALAGVPRAAADAFRDAIGAAPGDRERLGALVAWAEALGARGDIDAASLRMTEAIAVADRLAGPEGLRDAGAALRARWSTLLLGAGRVDEAEEVGWDAVRVGGLRGFAGALPGVASVLDAVDSRGLGPAALADAVAAIDEVLQSASGWSGLGATPGRRLVAALHEAASELARGGDPGAVDGFARALLVAAAVGVDSGPARRDLGWSALDAGRADVAAWALAPILPGLPAATGAAGGAALHAAAGRLRAAELALLETTRAGDPTTTTASFVRLGALRAARGDAEGALAAWHTAMPLLVADGAVGRADLAGVGAAVIDLLTARGRLLDAERVLLGYHAALAGDLPAAARARLSIARGRLLRAQGSRDAARAQLADAGRALLQAGRGEEAAALASEYGRIELRAGAFGEAAEAFASARQVEASLGLGLDGFRADAGLGAARLAAGDSGGAIEPLRRAAERVMAWAFALPPPDGREALDLPASLPPERAMAMEAVSLFASAAARERRWAEAFGAAEAAAALSASWARGEAAPAGPGAAERLALRDAIRAERTRPGDRPAEERTAPLDAALRDALEGVDTSLGCAPEAVSAGLGEREAAVLFVDRYAIAFDRSGFAGGLVTDAAVRARWERATDVLIVGDGPALALPRAARAHAVAALCGGGVRRAGPVVTLTSAAGPDDAAARVRGASAVVLDAPCEIPELFPARAELRLGRGGDADVFAAVHTLRATGAAPWDGVVVAADLPVDGAIVALPRCVAPEPRPVAAAWIAAGAVAVWLPAGAARDAGVARSALEAGGGGRVAPPAGWVAIAAGVGQ